MAISNEFLDGVFARRNLLGLSLVLKFAANADPRRAMSMLQSARAHGVRIDSDDEILVLAILQSGDWERAANHNIRVHVWGAVTVNPLALLVNFLEDIKLGTDHDLQKLQTGRQIKRNEAYADIVQTWITQRMRDHVRSWGMKLEHVLVTQPGGFNMVEITLSHDGEVIATYRLDGWSGMLNVNSGWLRDRRPTPASFNERVEGDIVEYLERATSTVLTA
jgi:hypothetical protein